MLERTGVFQLNSCQHGANHGGNGRPENFKISATSCTRGITMRKKKKKAEKKQMTTPIEDVYTGCTLESVQISNTPVAWTTLLAILSSRSGTPIPRNKINFPKISMHRRHIAYPLQTVLLSQHHLRSCNTGSSRQRRIAGQRPL